MFIYLNGQFIEQEKATISPFDHGYLYGLGVFETFRTYGGNPFLLEEHVERLNEGLEQLHIKQRFRPEEVRAIVVELSRKNNLTDSYIRFNVSAGMGEIGLQTADYEQATVIMFQKPLPTLENLREKEAVILKLARNTPETTIRLKSHHFFNNVAAKREVGPDQNREGIFLTQAGFLAEGVTSNLFWVRNHTLYTPSLETGILNGITRQFILKLANQVGMDVEEGLFNVTDLQKADEIFFTNSIQEIVPVSRLDERQYPGKIGDYVIKLNQLYKEEIEGIYLRGQNDGEIFSQKKFK
ncbi:aminodeoxychorismate lyase [Bacillus sp. FJAT-50079]|uniref:aminodeoxychorismate lyase n=1 Tax=Bacillus sp. FJAT-50079 TaxID=2833577 RepID=UPI001BC9E4EB|nr:aminodeoxychorismate lyase [Bacillus sp. FJAT-50079]MBS4209242.1 aminodeoxychorismate lyase [Bacillus sp. FJAT-50079]